MPGAEISDLKCQIWNCCTLHAFLDHGKLTDTR
jgi:hypothetical protein